MRAALIVDSNEVHQWQKDALDEARDLVEIVLVLSCSNTRNKRSIAANFCYYALGMMTLKNKMTRRLGLGIDAAKLVEFESIYDGNWQGMPDSVAAELRDSRVDIVIKFGMSLLRIDDRLSGLKVLSYHHGDPRCFRGRPAGFYELLQGWNAVGTVVQELSNELDAGRVWAMCHSRIWHHSYKKTAENFYGNSRFLLRKAIINLSNNAHIDIGPKGKNYRLPSNSLVCRFIVVLGIRKVKRLIYGAFFEKRWDVAVAENVDVLGNAKLNLDESRILEKGSEHGFYADPFFSVDGKKIRLEALCSKSGLGEIVEVGVDGQSDKKTLLKGRHYSYPFSFLFDNREYLLPEVSAHSRQYVLPAPFDAGEKIFLKGVEGCRIVDCTVFIEEGIVYLFFGMSSSAADRLYLFYSRGLTENFVPHPLSPVVIDPARARMAGRIVKLNGRCYRFGQDNSYQYGDGITVCEITDISASNYQERVVGRLRVEGARGPHTLDWNEQMSVFDFYQDRFSFFAWYRRVAPYIRHRLDSLRTGWSS
jgi:hypothetical protein